MSHPYRPPMKDPDEDAKKWYREQWLDGQEPPKLNRSRFESVLAAIILLGSIVIFFVLLGAFLSMIG